MTARQFEPGDVVVGHPVLLGMTDRGDGYDFCQWTRTKMRVVSVDDDSVLTQALDERPDRAVILDGYQRRGETDKPDPQDVIMCWPTRHVIHAD